MPMGRPMEAIIKAQIATLGNTVGLYFPLEECEGVIANIPGAAAQSAREKKNYADIYVYIDFARSIIGQRRESTVIYISVRNKKKDINSTAIPEYTTSIVTLEQAQEYGFLGSNIQGSYKIVSIKVSLRNGLAYVEDTAAGIGLFVEQ